MGPMPLLGRAPSRSPTLPTLGQASPRPCTQHSRGREKSMLRSSGCTEGGACRATQPQRAMRPFKQLYGGQGAQSGAATARSAPVHEERRPRAEHGRRGGH